MNSRFALDTAKLKRYLDENEGWLQTLRLQVKEFPAMKQMLDEVKEGEITRERVHFDTQLKVQQNVMKQLDEDLNKQQQRLTEDCETNVFFDIDAFLNQGILRERIKAIEKLFIDLKCNFMNYLATVA
jgi:hypothetical protein